MRKSLLFFSLCLFTATWGKSQIFYTDDFSNSAIWTLNSTPASITPAQGANDVAYNPWVINANDFFTPSGPISGNSLKITIQPGTDFDGLGLSSGFAGFDPFNVNERNITDAVALMNTNVSTVGRFGITLEFDFQTGGWLGDDYGTIVYSTDGGTSWTELDQSYTVNYTFINMNNQPLGVSGSKPAAPPNASTQNAFSNIDGFSSGALWHRASVVLPATCDNIPGLRIGFRWRNIDHLSNSPDYVGVSFNVDNIALRVDPPTADFTWAPDPTCVNTAVTFDPSASDPGGGASITGWIWTFSGGSPSTSTAQNPVVTWTSAGMDTVTLRVINNLGDTSTVASQYIFINSCEPVANFTSVTTVCTDSTMSFQDLSSNMTASFGTRTWSWTFNGGTPATANTQGPHNVSFATPGPHDVTLTVTNDYGSDDTTITINVVDCSCGALAAGGPIFFEDFDGNGGLGSNWITTPLNQSIGAQGASANLWYISDQENGNPVGVCGSGGGGNQTLHLGAQVGDLGAAYEIGCEPGCSWCDLFLVCIYSSTDKRSMSQNINTVGQSGMTLNFKYMESGDGTNDNATVEYSTDGGSTWNFLDDPPKTALTCAPQGIWTARSVALPAACEGIPNLRIAFRWVNNGDGVGTDPSFAVDDINIPGGAASPPVVWEGDVSNDWNTAANWSTNAIPTNADNVLVPDNATLTALCPGCVMPEIFAANAVAADVCNYGTITIHDTPTKRTLSVYGALLNEGAITTTSADPQYDVLMMGASSSYAGTGTNIDTDYEINTGQTTLLSDLSCRTVHVDADFDWDIFTVTVKRNFYHTSGTVSTTTSSTLLMDGPGAGFDTNDAQQLGSTPGVTIPNYIVNKSSGTVTLSTAAVHNVTERMTIIQGTVDAGTGIISGTGDLYMQAGAFLLARLGVTLPELTGTYVLTGGLVQLYGTGAQTLRGNKSYYDLEFTGTGVKTLGGDDQVQNELFLTLPTTTGNYVNANGFTLWELNPDPLSITRTGGHVVGELRRNINSIGTYRFYVGSDNSGTVTYYEPMDIQAVSLSGTSDITVAFSKNAPNPLTVSPALTELGATFTTMETEGYWEVTPDAQPSGGTFTVTEYPSSAWVFSNVSYTQVRQDFVGDNWDWNGSTRVTALKRKGYASFSNFGIASSSDPLPVTGLELSGKALEDYVHLDWYTLSEINTSTFEVERSSDGENFRPIGSVTAAGNAQNGAEYGFDDYVPSLGLNYYRLRQMDRNGGYSWSNTIAIFFGDDGGLRVWPNPAGEELHIAWDRSGSVQVSLLDALGREALEMEMSSGGVVQTGNLPRGVYLLKVQMSDGKVYSQKLVLQ